MGNPAKGMLISATAITLLAITAACGGSSSSNATIRGRVIPAGGTAARFAADCQVLSVTGSGPGLGDQVTVTDPGGAVIGTGVLGRPATAPPCAMPFTIHDVPHETRYGFAVNGVPGKLWAGNVTKTVTLAVQ